MSIRSTKHLWTGLLLALSLLASQPAFAGRSCEQKPPDVSAVTKGLELALNTARSLDASGAKVVLLARAGQDLSKYGLNYSHLGFAYLESPSAQVGSPGTWRVAHKLNQCGTAEAAVYWQGLGDFFLDSPFRYEAAYVVPHPALQDKLLALLRDKAALSKMHEKRYNMLAYPWAQTYQQSNQWAVETLALATANANDRAQAQTWMRNTGYQPTVLSLGPLSRLGARATAANIAFDDHPNDKRFSDRIETVTVDSVFVWLTRSGLTSAINKVR